MSTGWSSHPGSHGRPMPTGLDGDGRGWAVDGGQGVCLWSMGDRQKLSWVADSGPPSFPRCMMPPVKVNGDMQLAYQLCTMRTLQVIDSVRVCH